MLLAREKGEGGSRDKKPGRLVIGADQTLALGRRRFDKPRDHAAARAQLRELFRQHPSASFRSRRRARRARAVGGGRYREA